MCCGVAGAVCLPSRGLRALLAMLACSCHCSILLGLLSGDSIVGGANVAAVMHPLFCTCVVQNSSQMVRIVATSFALAVQWQDMARR